MNAFKKTALATAMATTVLTAPISAQANMKMTPAARGVFNSLSSSDFTMVRFNGVDIAAMKKTSNVDKFNDVANVSVYPAYQHGKTLAQINGMYNHGQCVSFVQALSGRHVQTKNWVPDFQITKYGPTPGPGSVIATFKNGTYSGHTAIFLRKKSNSIVVLDQNWERGKGYVSIHEIRFSGTGDVGDAGAYYTIE